MEIAEIYNLLNPIGLPPQLIWTKRAAEPTGAAGYVYTDRDQHVVWQVLIETTHPRPELELEIKHPSGVLQRSDGRGYLFRIALGTDSNEADRLNTAFSGELKEEDDIVLRTERTRLIPLAVPDIQWG